MKDIFTFLVANIIDVGDLIKANLCSEKFATIEFESEGEKFLINIAVCGDIEKICEG